MNTKVEEALKQEISYLNSASFELLERYKAQLKSYNSHTNVTALKEDDEIDEKHYFDSIILSKWMKESGKKVIDIGSGAGFPGLALAICQEENDFVLVESISKKTRLLESVSTDLELSNVEIFSNRAEELIRQKNWYEHFDFGVCRAVASLNVMLELVAPYLKVGGRLLAQKVNYEEEVAAASHALSELGCEIVEIDEYVLPISNQRRYVLVIEKKRSSDAKYPRVSKQIIKKPL